MLLATDRPYKGWFCKYMASFPKLVNSSDQFSLSRQNGCQSKTSWHPSMVSGSWEKTMLQLLMPPSPLACGFHNHIKGHGGICYIFKQGQSLSAVQWSWGLGVEDDFGNLSVFYWGAVVVARSVAEGEACLGASGGRLVSHLTHSLGPIVRVRTLRKIEEGITGYTARTGPHQSKHVQ